MVTSGQAAMDEAGRSEPGEYRQLTTLTGWRRFVAEAPSPPDLLERQAWQALDEAAREEYDEPRLAHHAQLLTVATPVIRKASTEGRRLTYPNRHADAGRCGLILSGAPRTGKTTAIIQMAKTLEIIHNARRPGGDDIPVIYITVPPAATAKMIAFEFARFLGLPVHTRANLTDIIEAVCAVCLDARTHTVCVDFTDRG